MSHELLYVGMPKAYEVDFDEYCDEVEPEDIDLEYLSVMRHSGKELLKQGQTIGHPFEADAWDYLLETTLITMHNSKFRENVSLMYMRYLEDSGDVDFIPSVLEIADAIDEWNMVVIHEFYSKSGYTLEDIDIINANYIQEFSCLMEDWVEEILQNNGCSYSGSSVTRSRQMQDDYAPQNILLTEFLR